MSAEKATNGNSEKAGVQRADTNGTAVDKALPFNAHTAGSQKVLEALSVDAEGGLTDADASKRVETYGPNRLKPPRRPSPWSILLRQVGNAMTLVLSEFPGTSTKRQKLTALVAAMAVSFGTMDWISGGVIAALVILNVSVGGYTEWQAEKVSSWHQRLYPNFPDSD
jgi:magnesium-transporting ATPase (P-type)